MRPVTDLPIPQEIKDAEILRALIGSTLYGTGLEGAEDTDLMGVCIAPWQAIYGLWKFEQFDWRSQPPGERSGVGDIDYSSFGLRKFMRLATNGNPTVLLLLFVPSEYCEVKTDLGAMLQDAAPVILSKHAGMRYLHYSRNQRKNLEQNMRGKANRPELLERFGYDTKYAMHALRLELHGIEVMTNGFIELPISKHKDLLLAIRYGEVAYEDVLRMLTEHEAKLIKAIEETTLPDKPQISQIHRLMRHAHESFYAKQR